MKSASPLRSMTSEPGVSAIELAKRQPPDRRFERHPDLDDTRTNIDARRIDVAQHVDVCLHQFDQEDAGISKEMEDLARRQPDPPDVAAAHEYRGHGE